MNKDRRKRIEDIQSKLSGLQSQLEEIRDEEEGAFDSLPESFQGGEKGEKMLEAIERLESACSSFEDIIDYLGEAI